jgi:hypothetical protein
MKCIKLYFKKRRLIKKYTVTQGDRIADIQVARMFDYDPAITNIMVHSRACQMRCVRRLKAL